MRWISYREPDPTLGIITLNDPENLNAMSEEMAGEFRALVGSLCVRKPPLRLLALTGAGRAFSAGGNLEMLERKRALSVAENQARMMEFYQSFLCVRSLPMPTVALINGHAIGAGLCLACACDIRIAATTAKLGVTFVKLGLHPGMGATYLLPRLLGVDRAKELMITGRVLSAEQALAAGLVSRIVGAEKLDEALAELRTEIQSAGPSVLQQLLETLRGSNADLQSALEREASCQAANYAGAEFAEGVRAAIEKRTAKF